MDRLLIKEYIYDFDVSFSFDSLLENLPKIKAKYPNAVIYMDLSEDCGLLIYTFREETDEEYDKRLNSPISKLGMEMNRRRYNYLKKMFEKE